MLHDIVFERIENVGLLVWVVAANRRGISSKITVHSLSADADLTSNRRHINLLCAQRLNLLVDVNRSSMPTVPCHFSPWILGQPIQAWNRAQPLILVYALERELICDVLQHRLVLTEVDGKSFPKILEYMPTVSNLNGSRSTTIGSFNVGDSPIACNHLDRRMSF
jgi:hypothetical protein